MVVPSSPLFSFEPISFSTTVKVTIYSGYSMSLGGCIARTEAETLLVIILLEMLYNMFELAGNKA